MRSISGRRRLQEIRPGLGSPSARRLSAVASGQYSVGPGLAWGWKGWPIFLVVGARAALLGEQEYKDKYFGGRLQFIEGIGLNIRLNRNLEAGYRLQHMSNAFMYDTNPGLNMHIFEFRYSF
jgi:hypothetical protein